MEITEREYRELVEKAKAGEILSKAIMLTSGLNYKKDGLNFDDSVINAALKATAYPHWERRMAELTAEWESEHAPKHEDNIEPKPEA